MNRLFMIENALTSCIRNLNQKDIVIMEVRLSSQRAYGIATNIFHGSRYDILFSQI